MFKISINEKECIGCSFCMNCCPDVFKFDENIFKGSLIKGGNLVNITEIELSPKQLAQVKEAEQGCPAQSINLVKI